MGHIPANLAGDPVMINAPTSTGNLTSPVLASTDTASYLRSPIPGRSKPIAPANTLSNSDLSSSDYRPLKKGEDCAPALWLRASVDHSAGVSDFFRRSLRFTSPRIAVTINCPSLSPSSLTNSTSCSTSRGTLAVFCRDLLLVVPVAISTILRIRWESLYIKITGCKYLRWESLSGSVSFAGDLHLQGNKSSEARKWWNTNRASDHNVIEAYTMAGTQHTQTHPKYQYRFMALLRADVTASPCRLTIEATSEQEARQRLSGRYILSFAGRVPALGVTNV